LHIRSANLENSDRILATAFGSLVQSALCGEQEGNCPRPLTVNEWWNLSSTRLGRNDDDDECSSQGVVSVYDGILHIAKVVAATPTAASQKR
jgi:hypothetical protein